MNRYYLFFCMFLLYSFVAKAQDFDNSDEEAVFTSKVWFKDFKVAVYKGKTAKLNLHSSHTAWLYRSALKEGYKVPEVNFCGHYKLITWGCGSPCLWGAIVDVRTGNVYDIPVSGVGYENYSNSSMLVLNPPDNKMIYLKNRPYEVPDIYIYSMTVQRNLAST